MQPRLLARTGCALLGLTIGCAASPAPPRVAARAPETAVVERSARRAEVTPAPRATPERPQTPPPRAAAEATTASAQELAEIERRLRALNLSAISARGRTPIASEPFQLEDLPRVTIPEPLDGAAAPDAAEGEAATELFMDWKGAGRPLGPPKTNVATSVRVSLKGHAYGRIRIGYADGIVNADGSGGAFVNCGGPGPDPHGLVAARWEVLATTPKGSLEYRVVNAWFDPQRCAATVVARAAVTAPRLAGGMLYAFRLDPAKSPDEEKLSVIGPRFTHLSTSAVGDADVAAGSFNRVTFSLRRGGGASMIGRVAASTAQEWSQMTGLAPVAPGEILVGLEITQGVDEPGPVAISYVGVPRPPLPSAPGNRLGEGFQAKSKLTDPFLTF